MPNMRQPYFHLKVGCVDIVLNVDEENTRRNTGETSQTYKVKNFALVQQSFSVLFRVFVF